MLLEKLIERSPSRIGSTSLRVNKFIYKNFMTACRNIGANREEVFELAMVEFTREVEEHLNKERVPVYKQVNQNQA